MGYDSKKCNKTRKLELEDQSITFENFRNEFTNEFHANLIKNFNKFS